MRVLTSLIKINLLSVCSTHSMKHLFNSSSSLILGQFPINPLRIASEIICGIAQTQIYTPAFSLLTHILSLHYIHDSFILALFRTNHYIIHFLILQISIKHVH